MEKEHFHKVNYIFVKKTNNVIKGDNDVKQRRCINNEYGRHSVRFWEPRD